MTGIRQSIVFSEESTYAQGKKSGSYWVAPPPGTFFTSTHNRDVQRVQTTGSKFWDAQAYGKLSGSWSWTFTFDYEYLEPFYFAFESVSRADPPSELLGQTLEGSGTSGKLYTFEKINNARVKSFTIRRKINNVMVGGSNNEITELTGCVVKEVSFSRTAATSKIDVTLSGFYANEVLVTDNSPNIWPTDYQDYNTDNGNGGLVEYSCLYIGDMSDNGGIYMANTESVGIKMENSAGQVYSICSPFASNYYEGLTNISFSTTCYSTDPLQYKTRLYSGGFTNRPPDGSGSSPYRPMSKGMKPVPSMCLACYSNQIIKDDPQYNSTDTLPYENVKTMFSKSKNIVAFELTQVVIKSMPWQKGDGSKLQDTISGSEVQKLKMYVKCQMDVDPSYWFSNSGAHRIQNYTTSDF